VRNAALNTFTYPEAHACPTGTNLSGVSFLFTVMWTQPFWAWENRMPPNPAMEFGRACRLLMKHFGSPDGDKTAAHLAITGLEDGLPGVLKAIAYGLANEYAENTIQAQISACWNRLSVPEKLAMSREFQAKFGHLLSADLREGGAAVRLAALLPQTLAKLPHVIKRLRSVGR